jgi:hypothetical protein
MAKRKESMLEAFQASAAESRSSEAKAPSPLEVGGPFAPPAVSSGSPGSIGSTGARRSGTSRPRRAREGEDPTLSPGPPPLPFGSVTFLFIQILLLAGAFALGRLTGGVQAAAGSTVGEGGAPQAEPLSASLSTPQLDSSGDAEGPSLEAAAAKEVEFVTDADRAFQEPANRYSIQAIQYANAKSELNRTLAYKTYDHLQDRGLPVVRPYRKGDNIFIYIGAAPTTSELKELLQRVKNTPGPHGSSDAFADAYLVPIPE